MLEQIVNIIEKKREKLGMSKSELCRRSGVSFVQYMNIISGRNTSISTTESILKALGVKSIRIKLK